MKKIIIFSILLFMLFPFSLTAQKIYGGDYNTVKDVFPNTVYVNSSQIYSYYIVDYVDDNRRTYISFNFSGVGNLSTAYLNYNINNISNSLFAPCYFVDYHLLIDGIYSPNLLTWNNMNADISLVGSFNAGSQSITDMERFNKSSTNLATFINSDVDKLFTIRIKMNAESTCNVVDSVIFNLSTFIEYNLSCVPNWVCSHFTNCINESKYCLIVEDLNSCDTTFNYPLANYTEECSTERIINYYYDDNNRKYINYSMVLWLFLIFIEFTTKKKDNISSIILVFSSVLGLFITIWIFKNYDDFPRLVTLIFGVINAFILVNAFNEK